MENTSQEHTSLEDENVTLLELEGKKIYLVGTAHVSKQSAELVTNIINEVKPDSVAVELCQPRYQSLTDSNRWKNLDLFTVIKQGKGQLLLAQLVLAGFQKKIASDLDITPGAEMMAAIETAKKHNAKIIMADREVKITLKRTWANLSFWQSLKVVGAMIGSMFMSADEISSEEIERLKSSDALEEVMREFSEKFPSVRESLIDERDIYLSQKIRDTPGKTIVAVVGAGHVPGIKEYIKESIDLAPLEVIPKPGKLRKVLPWLIPALVIVLVGYGFITADFNTGVSMIYYWVGINAILAAIGALIVLAHPLTILAAALSSPFTSLNPFVAAGWVAGLTEAFIRKPKVKDLESIADDIGSFKTAINNQAIKILAVIVSTNLFGTLGTFIGLERIINLAK